MFHVKQCTKAAAWAAGGRGELRRQLSASVGAASAASGFVGRGSLQLLGLRLLSAPGLARLRSAVGSSALLRPLRHPSPCHPSRSVCLRPPRFRSAAPLRPPLPPPLPPFATSSRLRCCPLPPKLLPLCIVSRETFILHCFTWNILHCFTWNIIVYYYKLFHVKHYRLLNNLQTHQSNSIFANNH